MIRALDLIQLQIRLEYALDENGLLVPFAGSSEQGLYIVYRYAEGYVAYYNQCLTVAKRGCLEELGAAQAFDAPQATERLIQEDVAAHCEGRFVSEYLPRLPGLEEFPLVVCQEAQYVVLAEGQPVCWAWSERSNDQCAEVAVETLPEYRRKGYARQAVAAWAYEVINSGRVAFYSYRAENLPSQKLARSLGAVWYADVVGYG